MTYVLGAVAGLAWGVLVAYLNSLITKVCLEKNSNPAIMASNLIHTVINIAALAVVFFLRKSLPFHFVAALVGTAAGMSISTIVFTFRLAGLAGKTSDPGTQETKEETQE